MKKTYIGTLAVAAVLLTGGCASKSAVNNLDAEVQGLQSEWRAFERGYDPAMRRELEANLQNLQALNDEVALLRDEVSLKAQRVSELLRQIDDNELDRALQECRRYADEADYFAATAQRHADAGLSYLEESRQTMRYAMQHHLEKHHRVDEIALYEKIERLEERVAKLQHALREQRRETSGNGRPDKRD